MSNVPLVVGVLGSQPPSPDRQPKRSLAVSQEIWLLLERAQSDPRIIWPRLSTARMPSINAGARVAPITTEVATPTGRDAKQILTGRGP